MARISKQIGWSNEASLLYDLINEVIKLQRITAKITGQETGQSGIISDYYNPTFFKAGRTYLNLNVTNSGSGEVMFSVGTTPGGTDLLSDELIVVGQTGSFEINQVFPVITPLYIWSLDWNGAIIEIKTVSL